MDKKDLSGDSGRYEPNLELMAFSALKNAIKPYPDGEKVVEEYEFKYMVGDVQKVVLLNVGFNVEYEEANYDITPYATRDVVEAHADPIDYTIVEDDGCPEFRLFPKNHVLHKIFNDHEFITEYEEELADEYEEGGW